MVKRRSLEGYLLIFISGILWGLGGYYVTKISNLGVSSLMIAFPGQFLALFPLLIYLLGKNGVNGIKISKKGLLYSIILGVLTKGIFKLAYDTTITIVGVSTASILLYLAPLFTAIMSMIFLKEKLLGYQYIALLLNLLGCIIVVTGGNFAELSISGLGLTLGILSGFLYALATVVGKVATSGDDPETMTLYMLMFGSITTGAFARPWQHLYLFTNSTFLFWIIFGAITNGLLANLLYLRGLSMDVDASKATIITSVEVVVATLVGVLLLNEKVNFVGYFGIAIMLVSIVLMNINFKKRSKEVAENEVIPENT